MFKIMKLWAVVVCVVLGLTSSAPAQWTNWHNTENPPITTGNIWSDDANWTNGTPGAGMGFRIEQYGAEAAVTGTIIMDVDYSAGALDQAAFFGAETVSIQKYFKATNHIKLHNGGNGPAGSYVRVDPTGTIWGDVFVGSSHTRPPTTIDFAGGDWDAGNLRYGNEHRSIFKVSSDTGSITPGAIQVTNAPWAATDPNRWPIIDFELASAGIAPVTLTDADPLQFTNDAAGTNPFKLSVDMTAYTGPAVDIPLITFGTGVTDTDILFDAAITIEGVPGDWIANVVQNDSGVTLILSGSTTTYTWVGGIGAWKDSDWDDGGGSVTPPNNADMVIEAATGDLVTVDEDFKAGAANGPAANVTVGIDGGGSDATLIIASGFELGATGTVDIHTGATLTVNGTLSPADTSVDGTLAGNGTIFSTTDAIEVKTTGTVAPSGVLTLGGGEMSLAGSFEAQVNAEAGQTAGDQIAVSAGILELGGTLKIAATGRTTFSNFEVEAVRRVVNVVGQDAAIGDGVGGGKSFDAVEPAISEHVGEGSFLQAVEYTTPGVGFDNIIGVDVELFIAEGGDTNGDGKVWLQDWLNFRPNFDSTGSEGLDWTDGDFDGDGRVWLSDWLIFRPGFSGTAYHVFPTEGEAVPEPGTLAMLLAGLIGLAVAGWRKR